MTNGIKSTARFESQYKRLLHSSYMSNMKFNWFSNKSNPIQMNSNWIYTFSHAPSSPTLFYSPTEPTESPKR